MDPIKLRPQGRRFPLEVETDGGPTTVNAQRADRTKVALDEPEPTLAPDPDGPATIEAPSADATLPPAGGATGAGVALDPFDQIERYELGDELGRGTFGRVFAARDRKLGRRVAIKVLHPAQAANVEICRRFVQEAHAAACIAHPGIVMIFDVGEAASGALYIAMELLAGESLQARVARLGRLPLPAVIEIGRQVASAVAAAHAAGVVHRDLKPENIFLVPDAAAAIRERAKVLDFGLAKPADAAVKTQVATVFGTPAYMSPEQCRGTGGLDHRTDIYSLGCILFQLATGAPPFTGSLREVITGHQTVEAPRLDGDAALAELVAGMLAKRPEHRPATMALVEQALTREAPQDAPRPARRRWFGWF